MKHKYILGLRLHDAGTGWRIDFENTTFWKRNSSRNMLETVLCEHSKMKIVDTFGTRLFDFNRTRFWKY